MSQRSGRITFLQINDLHGYLEPHQEMVRDEGEWRLTMLGGLSRIATLFHRVREAEPGAVIALDNGDTFHGTYAAVRSKGHAMVPMMNALELDAMTLHWEFAYGPDGVRDIARELSYPMLPGGAVSIGCLQGMSWSKQSARIASASSRRRVCRRNLAVIAGISTSMRSLHCGNCSSNAVRSHLRPCRRYSKFKVLDSRSATKLHFSGYIRLQITVLCVLQP